MVNQGNRNLWRRMGQTKKVRVEDFEEEEKWHNYWREKREREREREREEREEREKREKRERKPDHV